MNEVESLMSETKLLDTINSPVDVKALTEEQLVQLAGEIRQLIIEVTAKNAIKYQWLVHFKDDKENEERCKHYI